MKRGFTLIELILVIAILGILAISALPKFISISGDAERASRDGVVGAVRSGIALYRANAMVDAAIGGTGRYPTTLDSNGAAACTTCFSTILSTGVSDSSWTEAAGNIYTFNDGTSTTNYTFTGGTTGTFE